MEDTPHASGPESEPAPHAPPPPGRQAIALWKRPVVVLTLFSVAVGGGALAGALESGLTPSETVMSAAVTTLAARTAHVTFLGGVATGSASVTVSGSGSVDLANGSFEESITEPSEGVQVTIEVVNVGNRLYVHVPQLSQIDPGKSWLSIDLPALTKDERESGLNNLGDSPAAILPLLAQAGNTVTPIGSSTVDGQRVQGYAIAYSTAAIERAISSSSAPSWLHVALRRISVTHERSTVYIDGSDQIVRMTDTAGVSAGGTAGAINGSVDLSDYGIAVSVSPPPADQVVRFSQFLQMVGGGSDA